MKRVYISILLVIIVFVSYGQILGMGLWKDDNAIFFKLQHINETAGFFGRGIIGEGPYHFSFTPYWFVYKIFGQNSTLPYYILIFIFYFLAAFAVYKFFSLFISRKAGVIAGILFSCGFVAAEGFYWLANAMVSDVSIILLFTSLFFYYKYFLKRKILFYILAIIFYWASSYFTTIRAYYFVGIIVLFELVFFASQKTWRAKVNSVLRLIPPVGIFYYFFVNGVDARSGLVKDILQSLAAGKLYISYGFLSALANVIFSDLLTAKFFEWEVGVIKITTIGLPYVIIGTITLAIFGFCFLFKGQKYSKRIILASSMLVVVWSLIANQIFNVPIINPSKSSNYVAFLGGVVLIFLFMLAFRIEAKARAKYIFLTLSFLISIGAYWVYDPLVVLNTTHRYLVGAFSMLIGLFAFIYVNSNKRIKLLIICWGFFNLISSFRYQNQILDNRTYPVNNFYSQLKTYLPIIKKGDVFYFDLGDSNARNYFQEAVSTASMPNETSFAWRYGLDRYDFKIVNNFSDMTSLIKDKNISGDQIHAFYYLGDKLVDTTVGMRKLLEDKSVWQSIQFTTNNESGNLIVHLKNPIGSLTPSKINMKIAASLPDSSQIKFPYVQDVSFSGNEIAVNPDLRNEAFRYLNRKKNILRNLKMTTSSYWMTDTSSNLSDGDKQTNWRANRLTWAKEETNLVVDLGRSYEISEFIWINGFGNSTPTKYSIDVSLDGKNWKSVEMISNTKRIDSKDPQVITFDSQNLRYMKMNFYETLDGDAPQISEVWAAESDFDNLNIKDTERFLSNPFGYVPDLESFKSTLKNLGNSGEVSVNDISRGEIIYDGVIRTYTFTIPAGGITISELIMKNLQIPGNLALKDVSYKNLDLKEIR